MRECIAQAIDEIAQISAPQPPRSAVPELSAPSMELLDTCRTLAEAKSNFDPEAITRYIVSGAESEDDIFAVLRLAALSGLRAGGIGERSRRDAGSVVRIDRGPAKRAGGDATGLDFAGVSRIAALMAWLAGGHAGLLGLEQRWRHARPARGSCTKRIADCIAWRASAE